MRFEITDHAVNAVTQIAANPKTTYSLSAVLGSVSVLTFNELVGAVGVFCSIILATFTAWSNHKRNRAQIRAAIAEEVRAKANAFPHELNNEANHGR